MTQIRMNFYSRTLGRPTDAVILLPEGSEVPQSGCPVLYLFHGFSDGYTSFLSKSILEQCCSEQQLCVVMPDGAKSFYTDMHYGDAYWTYISEELPELISTYFPISREREKTFAGGVSMGGYGALKLALRSPGLFSAALALAPVTDIARLTKGSVGAGAANAPDLSKKWFEAIFGPRDPMGSEDDLFALIRCAEEKPRLLLYCGTEDFLYEDILRFHAGCMEQGFEASLVTAPGLHGWSTWNGFLQDGILKLLQPPFSGPVKSQ